MDNFGQKSAFSGRTGARAGDRTSPATQKVRLDDDDGEVGVPRLRHLRRKQGWGLGLGAGPCREELLPARHAEGDAPEVRARRGERRRRREPQAGHPAEIQSGRPGEPAPTREGGPGDRIWRLRLGDCVGRLHRPTPPRVFPSVRTVRGGGVGGGRDVDAEFHPRQVPAPHVHQRVDVVERRAHRVHVVIGEAPMADRHAVQRCAPPPVSFRHSALCIQLHVGCL
eukprot:gene9667-biopygen9801